MANDSSQALAEINKAIASQAAVVDASNGVAAQSSQLVVQDANWWSVENAMTISAVVLVFGLVTIGIAAGLILRRIPHIAVLRVLGTVLILVFAVFLVVAGYSDKQIASVLGLLGTVAGYLLGKSENPNLHEHRDQP
ncbi:hypothetical protein [Burkholderia thailandensis]|uniref:hypothetical protein n=1 Tax=Burkholderia thailandensis TaxID=57975 RepID=UPI0012DAB294|nr:hypothetical protein [Burkholderia thailandensis]